MAEVERWRMSCGVAPCEHVSLPGCRALTPGDGARIGALLHEAYRGTVDDEGERLDDAVLEAERALVGGYGPVDWAASFVVVEDDRALSLSLVTTYEGRALLAFSATHPAAQRRGLARTLIRKRLTALASSGQDRLFLVVTAANTPAVRLYESMGFERC